MTRLPAHTLVFRGLMIMFGLVFTALLSLFLFSANLPMHAQAANPRGYLVGHVEGSDLIGLKDPRAGTVCYVLTAKTVGNNTLFCVRP